MNAGGLPFMALPPSDAHVEFWRSGSLSEGRPWPLHYPGPLAYSGRLSGALGALYSILNFQQPRSQPVNRLLHPSKLGFVPSYTTNTEQPPFGKFN